MRRFRWSTFGALALVSMFLPAASLPVAADNLAPNPAFAEGAGGTPAQWRFWGWAPEGAPCTSTGAWDRVVDGDGTNSLRINNPGERDVGTWTNRQEDGFIPVEPGEVYTVSARMMAEFEDRAPFTNFRVGFARIDAEGQVHYLPVETRRAIDPAAGRFTESGAWKHLAVAARAPAGATHMGMDIDLHGQGVAWIADVTVTRGWDTEALGGPPPAAELVITGDRLQGADGQARRDWLLANRKEEYYSWWYTKKREFMLALRDHLRALRPDLKLFYFPWHSDDDYPFTCGRLRYSGEPMMDLIYVPGTNILLVPHFTVPPEQWTDEEKRHPSLARRYYRERIAPDLEGLVTLENVLYGRYVDMPEFWGAPRSGALPHLLYPHELDLVSMFTEAGGVYANHVGHRPQLYREDDGLIYWAPVRHRFTADNPEFLDLFRTGEGAAVAVHMPYNEETTHLNVPAIHGALGVEHGGAYSMMEEVLSMAHADPLHIMASMWEPLKRGFPHHARAFAKAYRALPALPSTVLQDAVSPADEEIVLRSYETDYGHYLAVINRASDLERREPVITLNPAVREVASVVNLGTGDEVSFTDAGEGRIRINLHAPSMSLTSLRIMDRFPAAVVRDVRITPAVFSPAAVDAPAEAVVTARTVEQITGGQWAAEVRDAAGGVVRRFEGEVPDIQFTWDGTDAAGERCPDGHAKWESRGGFAQQGSTYNTYGYRVR